MKRKGSALFLIASVDMLFGYMKICLAVVWVYTNPAAYNVQIFSENSHFPRIFRSFGCQKLLNTRSTHESVVFWVSAMAGNSICPEWLLL